jgi:hypothetical protein
MRTAIFAALCAAAFFAIPSSSASAQDIQLGPGGVRIYPHHHHGYGADCRALRAACMRKGELGEQGQGNCRRYREICR